MESIEEALLAAVTGSEYNSAIDATSLSTLDFVDPAPLYQPRRPAHLHFKPFSSVSTSFCFIPGLQHGPTLTLKNLFGLSPEAERMNRSSR